MGGVVGIAGADVTSVVIAPTGRAEMDGGIGCEEAVPMTFAGTLTAPIPVVVAAEATVAVAPPATATVAAVGVGVTTETPAHEDVVDRPAEWAPCSAPEAETGRGPGRCKCACGNGPACGAGAAWPCACVWGARWPIRRLRSI